MPKFEVQVFESPEYAAHRFPPIVYNETIWDLSHLDSFAFKCDPGLGCAVTVLVMFSCHCFSRSIARDGRARAEIPDSELYDDGREQRVLDAERPIVVANERQPNFMTLQKTHADGTSSPYAVFFEVEKDRARKQRLILRIQSAYLLENQLSKRQRQAKKVSFKTLLRAAYEGRKIRTSQQKRRHKNQRLPFGSRRMRDSLSTFRQNFHFRWNPVTRAALRFSHPLVRSFEA